MKDNYFLCEMLNLFKKLIFFFEKNSSLQLKQTRDIRKRGRYCSTDPILRKIPKETSESAPSHSVLFHRTYKSCNSGSLPIEDGRVPLIKLEESRL